jgi:hypothetical protein
LPASATEWIDSASIEAAPVNTNATNLAIAIPRLARNAAKIARCCPRSPPPSGGDPSATVVTGRGDDLTTVHGHCLL